MKSTLTGMSDTGREHGSAALMHQMFPTTLLALPNFHGGTGAPTNSHAAGTHLTAMLDDMALLEGSIDHQTILPVSQITPVIF